MQNTSNSCRVTLPATSDARPEALRLTPGADHVGEVQAWNVDTGARVDVQHALLIQRPGLGDALMEIDSNGNEADTPRTNLKVANFTALQPSTSSNNESNDQAATLFRGNSDTTLINGVIVVPNNESIRMNGSGAAN